jgi:putative oxidoreductase
MKLHIPKKERLFSAFVLIVRLGLGCIFIWSSVPKIRQPYDFLSSVYNYELAGPKLGMLVAITLPWVELLVGVCLVGGIFIGGALLVSVVMATMFTFALAFALYHGLQISCGCFGSSSTENISYATLVRACVILLLALLSYVILVFLYPHTRHETA